MQVYGAGRSELPAALVHAPLAVFPVAYPRASYEKAQAAMPVFNLLIDRISRDGEYLQETLAPAAEFDDFTVSFRTPSAALPPCWSVVHWGTDQSNIDHVFIATDSMLKLLKL